MSNAHGTCSCGCGDGMSDSGEITVTVSTPDGLPAPWSTSITYKPETAEEFEAIVAALGGSLAFQVLTECAFTHSNGVTAYVYQPKDVTPPATEPAPFMRAFQKRIDDTKAFQKRLEAAA